MDRWYTQFRQQLMNSGKRLKEDNKKELSKKAVSIMDGLYKQYFKKPMQKHDFDPTSLPIVTLQKFFHPSTTPVL